MDKQYKLALVLGVIPFFVLSILLTLWINSPDLDLLQLTLPLIIFSSICIILGFYVSFSFLNKAKARKSARNIGRTLLPVGLLILNVPLALVTYNTAEYIKATFTVAIDNRSKETVKKLFFQNGKEKYFVKPIEAGTTFTKALVFNTEGLVTYTFTLGNQEFTGTLFKHITPGKTSDATMTITRTQRVIIEEN